MTVLHTCAPLTRSAKLCRLCIRRVSSESCDCISIASQVRAGEGEKGSYCCDMLAET